jgi:hypothetical protein
MVDARLDRRIDALHQRYQVDRLGGLRLNAER